MENYCFKSDKYTVKFTENGIVKTTPVYVALVCDGDGNNKTLPHEVFAEFDGLGMGTNTTKAYFTAFEFDQKADIEIFFNEGTTSRNRQNLS